MIRALLLARQRDVDRVVLHHRAGDAVLARELEVAQLRLRVDGRRAEVVAQAQRVADLVHRDVLEVGQHERLGLRAVGVELAARLQQVEARSRAPASRIRRSQAHAIRGVATNAGSAAGGRICSTRIERAAAQTRRIDADVGVEDLAGARIDLARADGAERRPCASVIQRIDAWRASSVSKSASSGWIFDLQRVLEADLLERLVPLEHAVGDRLSRYFSGMLRSSQKTIGCFGSESAAAGSFFSSRQRWM